MQLTPIAKAIKPINIIPLVSYRATTRITSPTSEWVLAPDLGVNNTPITKEEFKTLTKYPLALIDVLRKKQLKVKHLELFFTVLQHTFYFYEMCKTNTAKVKKIVCDMTEREFLPRLRINDKGVYESAPDKQDELIKIYWKHSQAIIEFEQLFIQTLERELFVTNYRDGRQRYAEILNEGLINYRIYIELLPDFWKLLVDVEDFKEHNNVFRAHQTLQAEINKLRSNKIWNI